jgi:hypothetical protein
MIRLLVAAVVCLALQPAAATGASARERTVVAARGGDQALPAALDWHCDGAVAAGDVGLAPPVWIASSGPAPRSFAVVARLWLREQRLLC